MTVNSVQHSESRREGRTCLITGGAGFIGCAIAPALAQEFERVVAIDNLHPQIHAQRVRPEALDDRVELVVADVTREEAWTELLADVAPEVVIHLAAETGTGQSLTEATRHAEVNVVGTTRMLDAFVALKRMPRRVVLTSSRAVYGEGAWIDSAGACLPYPASDRRRSSNVANGISRACAVRPSTALSRRRAIRPASTARPSLRRNIF